VHSPGSHKQYSNWVKHLANKYNVNAITSHYYFLPKVIIPGDGIDSHFKCERLKEMWRIKDREVVSVNDFRGGNICALVIDRTGPKAWLSLTLCCT